MTPQEKEKLKNSLKNHTSPYDGNDGMISTIIAQMLVDDMPEPKKVKVPKWFAEWVEARKGNTEDFLIWSIYTNQSYPSFTKEQIKWLERIENRILAVKAILYGYEPIEPLYLMPVPYANNMNYYRDTDGEMIACFKSDKYTEFTAAEIDEHFPKIKEFAEEVEG